MDTVAQNVQWVNPTLTVDPELIPNELRDVPQWVAWQAVPRADRAKPAKRPIDPRTGNPARVNAPATWAPLADALDLYRRRGLSGIGYVFTPVDPYCGIDLDGCRDPLTGALDPWAEEIAAVIDSYGEVSPSGTGIKLVVRGSIPPQSRNRLGGIEVYDRGRYFALTGWRLAGCPADIRDRQDKLTKLSGRLDRRGGDDHRDRHARGTACDLTGIGDDVLLGVASAAKNGPKFLRLWAGDWSGYSSRSEADLALACLLAFWTAGNSARIDAYFRRCGLFRPKWDEVHAANGSSYGQITVRRAVAHCPAFYGAADLSRPSAPQSPKKQNRVILSHPQPTPAEQAARLLDHIRACRGLAINGVSLSVRQAATVIGASRPTAARRLAELLETGRLVRVARGFWDSRNRRPGAAGRYDLPVTLSTPVRRSPERSSASISPPYPPPYTHTTRGLVAVWHWSTRHGHWQHYGDCRDLDTAKGVAGRHMQARSGSWAIGNEVCRYVRGRALRIIQNQKGTAK